MVFLQLLMLVEVLALVPLIVHVASLSVVVMVVLLVAAVVVVADAKVRRQWLGPRVDGSASDVVVPTWMAIVVDLRAI